MPMAPAMWGVPASNRWGISLYVVPVKRTLTAPGGRTSFEAPLLDAGLFTCEIDRHEVRRHRVSDPTLRSERLDVTLAELERIQRERRNRHAGPGGTHGMESSP